MVRQSAESCGMVAVLLFQYESTHVELESEKKCPSFL